MVTGLLEIAGAIGVVAQLSAQLYQIGKKLRRCQKALNHAKEDINQLYSIVREFRLILEDFHQTEQDAAEVGCGLSDKTSLVVESLSHSCRQDFDGIDQVLASVDPLRTDKHYTKLRRWKARYDWLSRRDDVDKVLVSLNASKMSLSLVLQLLIFRQLVKTISDHVKAGENVKARLQEKL